MTSIRFFYFVESGANVFESSWEVLPETGRHDKEAADFLYAFNEWDFHTYFSTRDAPAARELYLETKVTLILRLLGDAGASTVISLLDRKPRGRHRYYAYTSGSLWSAAIPLTTDQWISQVQLYRQRENTLLRSIDEPVSLPNRFIPIDVRHEVWARDFGKCVNCGSKERLEFDHIIPVALGGSNTARNLQLLCETCNREKGATLG